MWGLKTKSCLSPGYSGIFEVKFFPTDIGEETEALSQENAVIFRLGWDRNRLAAEWEIEWVHI